MSHNNNSRSYSNINNSIIGENIQVSINGNSINKMWDDSKKEVLSTLRSPSLSPSDSELLESIYEILVKKDEPGLKNFFKKHLEAFKVNIASGIIGNSLYDLLKTIGAFIPK